MDLRINEVHSRVETTDSKALLDPRVVSHIVRTCLKAIKENQATERRMAEERSLTPGVSSDES